jgi:hypothetical protein
MPVFAGWELGAHFAGLRPREEPTKRGCRANASGYGFSRLATPNPGQTSGYSLKSRLFRDGKAERGWPSRNL